VRTGDTPAAERSRALRRPPHIVVTTPESLYILLGSESGRTMLATTRTVIVDEIHAMAPNKRGTHLALSLERLEALCGRKLLRIGLSATQKPIDTIARFLVGAGAGDARPACRIIDSGHRRERDLALEVPDSPLEAIMSAEVWTQVYDRLARLIEDHRTTLIFVNTRRMAERVARQLSLRLDHPPPQGERRRSERSELSRGGVAAPQPPHPARLRFAAASDPPPAGEGEERSWRRSASIPRKHPPPAECGRACFPCYLQAKIQP
jgi:Lhr-like helicase